MAQNWVLGGLIVTTALGVALILQLLARAVARRRAARHEAEAADQQTVFLFEGERLLDATGAAHDLLAALPPGDDWARLAGYLAPRFPHFPGLTVDQPDGAQVYVGTQATGCGRLRLDAEYLGGRLRLTLSSCGSLTAEIAPIPAQALADELAEMRATLEAAPVLSWRETPEGQVTWANAAYRHLVHGEGDAQPWPLPRLFEPAGRVATAPQRVQSVPADPTAARWFDIHDCPAGETILRFAIPADAAVRAEDQLREFVQTLSRTFADLPVGLAVFDRHRRLLVFNPALADLTTLSVGFLSARPSFEDVLDHLREARMMPEPKDYRSWRQQMVALEAAAAAGYHCETWSLPGGQTYRVTGRPHPGGAIALLIEDISTAVTLTRKFRAEVDLIREVLDRLDLAICVVGRDGEVATANAASRRLIPELGHEGARFVAGLDPADTTGALALHGALAGHIDWSGALRLAAGPSIACKATPISGGMTLLHLTPAPAKAPTKKPVAAPIGAGARSARELAAVSRKPRSKAPPAVADVPAALPAAVAPLPATGVQPAHAV